MKDYRRLTAREVQAIRQLAEQEDIRQVDIAERFGCSQTNVSSILRGNT